MTQNPDFSVGGSVGANIINIQGDNNSLNVFTRKNKQILITAKEFFHPLLNAENLFNHTWSLVGRINFIEELNNFVKSKQQRVAILNGRGGIGKTKILHTFAQQFHKHHQQFTLRFLMQGVPITLESLDELPAELCVIVVDDAHQRDDLSILLAFVQQNPQRFKLVFSSRPQGIDYLLSRLTQTGFDSREILEFEILKELSRDEVKELATQVLGNEYAHYAERLAIITRDCPLITVIGGKLLAEKKVDPLLLERDKEFRDWILKRFQDESIGRVSDRIEPQLCHNLLKLISATAPIRLTNEEFKQIVADFLSIDKPTLVSTLGVLETSGILLRRGDTLRITPDVLSDYILHNACLTEQGDLTDYAKKIFDNYIQVCPEQVLRNLAELDWRIYHTNGEEIGLLTDIWQMSIKEEFQRASNFDRCQILKLLKEVAYYQPEKMLDIVELAMRNPATTPEDKNIPQRYHFTHADVLLQLPELLNRIGYNLDYLPRCCDLLWQLAKDDRKELNPRYERPIEILTKLAKYDIYKSLNVNKIVLDSVAKWLKKPNVHNHIYSPLDILEALLEKNSHSTRSHGLTLKSYTFPISREKTNYIREQAINLIQDCTKSEQLKVVLRGLISLGRVLKEPHDMVQLKVSDEQREEWVPEQLQILCFISKLIQAKKEPLIHFEVIEILKWHIHFSYSQKVKQKALEIINLIPDNYEFRLIGVLTACGSLDWFINNRGKKDIFAESNYKGEPKRIQNILFSVSEEFLKRHLSAKEGVSLLNEKLRFIQEAGIEINTNLPDFMGTYRLTFLETIADNAESEYVIQMCEAIIKDQYSNLAPQISFLLYKVRQLDINRAIKIAQLAIDTESPVLCASIAEGCRTWLNNLQPEDAKLIRKLLGHKDIEVKGRTIHSLWIMKDVQPKFITAMALAVDVGNSAKLANEVCRIFHPEWGIPLDNISDIKLEIILQKLEPISSISGYSNISKFVAYVSQNSARLFIQFLLSRIEYYHKHYIINYHPIPFSSFDHKFSEIEKSNDYEDILKAIRDKSLQNVNINNFWLSKLFKEISLDFNSTSLKVLEEWINSEDAQKVQVVSSFLSHAPESFVLTNVEFTANLLEQAYNLGDDCYQIVTSNLHSKVPSYADVRVVFSLEEPIREDIALQNQALTISKNFPKGSPVHKFYSSLAKSAKAKIEFWQKYWEEKLKNWVNYSYFQVNRLHSINDTT